MVALIGEQFKPILTTEDFKVFTEVADSLKAGKIVNRTLPAALAPIFTPSSQAFLISTLKCDTSKEMQKLKVPVLVIGGSKDLQVPADDATQLAKMNKGATLKIVQEMNHVLKKAPLNRGENLATYNNRSLQLHEEVIPILTSFIKNNTNL
jgi:fermentation-respiration switch protein FrsA (DUF1100 family)